jgi:hypothetical protein
MKTVCVKTIRNTAFAVFYTVKTSRVLCAAICPTSCCLCHTLLDPWNVRVCMYVLKTDRCTPWTTINFIYPVNICYTFRSCYLAEDCQHVAGVDTTNTVCGGCRHRFIGFYMMCHIEVELDKKESMYIFFTFIVARCISMIQLFSYTNLCTYICILSNR